jgi:tetratricopeptide (TPR) repeat protein
MLEHQGRTLLETGQMEEAILILKKVTQVYQSQGNTLRQAATLGNLSVIYQKLGQWSNAEESIAASLQLLQLTEQNALTTQQSRLFVLAQILEAHGNFYLAKGQVEEANSTWEQAIAHYTQLKNAEAVLRNRVNQSKALQARGRYRRAIELLGEALGLPKYSDLDSDELAVHLSILPTSPATAAALKSLGDALKISGSLEQASSVLERGLRIAQQLQLAENIEAIHLSLGNLAQIQGKQQEALIYYHQADTELASSYTRIQAQGVVA